MHTNFDKAEGGMNDLLADALGLEDVRAYTDDECISSNGAPLDNIGRVGYLEPPMSLEDFADFVRATLGSRNLRTVGNSVEEIRTVALCSGSGGDLMECALHSGADVYLTADIGHHDAQFASEIGLNIIDAGHFETENIFCDFMIEYFEDNFPEIETAKAFVDSYFN
jgi:dinuclear metal center YbgI/SA1388 family protein